MPAELVIHIGEQERKFPLADFNIIGRSKDAAIQLLDAGVSREHASIRRDSGSYWVNDLGSANGTYVNDLAVTSSQRLVKGDQITFGTVTATFTPSDSEEEAEEDANMFQTQVLKRTEVKVTTTPLILLVGDIRGFTQISAKVPAEELASLVRTWYDDCRSIIGSRGGIIDKFIGDAVFAYWKDTGIDTRYAALDAARALRDGADFTQSGIMVLDKHDIQFECRVGLHLGEVALGAMTKGNNTALGDAVNLAFRLESLTRELDSSVLASAAFLDGWEEGKSHFAARGFQRIKGHPAPVEVFSLNA